MINKIEPVLVFGDGLVDVVGARVKWKWDPYVSISFYEGGYLDIRQKRYTSTHERRDVRWTLFYKIGPVLLLFQLDLY